MQATRRALPRSRPATHGSGIDAACAAAPRDCAGRRRRARRAGRGGPAPFVPTLIPPGGREEGGEPLRWWRRVPAGVVLVVLLGAFVLWAALSQGEDPFSGYLAIP